MADPLKTLILKAVEEAVRAVAEVAEVRRNPPTTPSRETAVFPAVWVYDDTERRVRNNRYSVNTFTVQVETYFLAEDTEASDQADRIDAGIYAGVLSNAGVLALVADIRPDEEASVSKQYVDETMGVVISRYRIQYRHAYGDATNPMK